MKRSKFARDEDGALLVFFAICAAAIFLVASLSFDLGQRASTQSELQSFADNVALAAAGELNGFPGAIERSERAARELIRDNFVFGVEADGGSDRTLQGESDYEIFFYQTLPPDDETGMTAESALVKDPSNDRIARFARVVVKDVNVDWDFANLLTIFSNDPLPSEAVNAEAVAGYTSLQCDVSPVFFCQPDDQPNWTPTQEIGKSIHLKAGASGSGTWTPGNFTWLNVVSQSTDAWTDGDIYNPVGPCAEFAKKTPPGGSGEPSDLYECLFAAGTGTLCFVNGELQASPGGGEGKKTAVFNTRFDLFGKGSGSNQTDPIFAPAPVVTTGLTEPSTCGSSVTPTNTTMGLPADDCFTGHGKGGCREYPATVGDLRYGDGNWSRGRMFYADVNYSFDHTSVGTPLPTTDLIPDVPNVVDDLSDPLVVQDEIVTIDGQQYHRYDPMRPVGSFAKPDIYKDFPVLDNSASQWEYYQAEVAASLYDNPADRLDTVNGEYVFTFDTTSLDYRGTGAAKELIQDIEDSAGNLLYDRLGNSRPNCAPQFDPSPRRRTLVAAVMDCSDDGINGGINGNSNKQLEANFFVDVFLLTSSGTMRNTANGSTPNNPNADKEIFVQIIGPALNSGEYTKDPGRFRNLVQLYR